MENREQVYLCKKIKNMLTNTFWSRCHRRSQDFAAGCSHRLSFIFRFRGSESEKPKKIS